MSGEASKESGEIGEALASELLRLIGWKPTLKPISIPCALPDKHNKTSHGEDGLFIYNSPFLEGVTDVVHVSVKHKKNGYSKGSQGIRSELKGHLTELNTIIACAQLSPDVKRFIVSHQGKPKKIHRGLLVWMHSDKESLERDIRQDLGGTQLSTEHTTPIFLIDSGRASFIYNAIRHYQALGLGDYSFYYPRLGNSISTDQERFGNILPLELIASDIIPIRGMQEGRPLLHLYVREHFSSYALKKAYAMAHDFGDAWVESICIGFDDYNESHHSQARDEALFAFQDITKVSVFSYKSSLLSLLENKS
ncbi:MAG: hypothetical protein Q7U91_10535 [Sideroxyarcus sp.]|nr:hypothetical protein [Sideroxyarcus sp.]